MRYILLFLFLLLTPSSASAVWFDSNWAYRVPVEVVPSKVGTSSAITNFPVYVDLGQFPASFFNNASTSDIRVTKSDGSTEVAFEVVSLGSRQITTETQYIDTSTTTWQLPNNAFNPVTIEAWGGGGGGGDGSTTGGGGGGGGAYASSSLTLATSTNYSITIGTGGAKGAATSAGGFGATTTFNGGQVSVQGGRGGAGCSSANCAGGAGGLASASVGSSTYDGGTGGTSNNIGDLGGGGGEAGGSLGTGANASGKTAGTSAGSGGDGGTGGANAGSGANGLAPGGGGGGGENNSVGATGNGADGRVAITYSIATTTEYFGELHLLANDLSTTSTTTFYVYYGNPSASAYADGDTYGANNVWVNYVMVTHRGNKDSKGTYTMTAQGGVSVGGIDTPSLKEGTSFNGTTQYFTMSTSTGLPTGNNAYTVTQWIYPTAVNASYFPIEWGATNRLTINSGTGVLVGNYAGLGAIYQIGRGSDYGTTGVATAQTWQHIAVTYNPNSLTIFRNGNSVFNNAAITSKAVTLEAATIGSNTNGTENWKGNLSEIRVSSSALSSAWILTEYNNQSSPSTFLWIGAEECDGGCGGGGGSSEDGGVIWFD